MPTENHSSDADSSDERAAEPTDEEVVEAAAEAAERVVFSRYKRSAVDDYDVSITFEDGILEVDVLVDAGQDDEAQVADDAALAARTAVDQLFEGAE